MKTPEQWRQELSARWNPPPTHRCIVEIQSDARADLEQHLRGAWAQIAELRQREHSCYTALGANASSEGLAVLIERRMGEAQALVRELSDSLKYCRQYEAGTLERADAFLSLVVGNGVDKPAAISHDACDAG